ncbi:MAG: hypothetical protein MPI95_07930 [Nitrosopumilus sp.]|nr:hypothetical protein [Nitrosopumilus sp.]MDA7960859.1 hypothetical protein [Nitrosopumilus sp.]
MLAAFAMYDAGYLGVASVVTGGSQVAQWDTARVTKASVMVFEGVVKSTETKLVYEPPITISPETARENAEIIANLTGVSVEQQYEEDRKYADRMELLPNGHWLASPEREVPYSYVTVHVTEWFKDEGGELPGTVTFRDYPREAVGKIGGRPALFENLYAAGYEDGEKAIFFVQNLDGELATHGALQVFRYDGEGGVYLPYFEGHMEPFDAGEFKAEIRDNL